MFGAATKRERKDRNARRKNCWKKIANVENNFLGGEAGPQGIQYKDFCPSNCVKHGLKEGFSPKRGVNPCLMNFGGWSNKGVFYCAAQLGQGAGGAIDIVAGGSFIALHDVSSSNWGCEAD